MTAKRTLKRDTLKALERAAMRAYRVNFSKVDEQTGARARALESLWKACAAHAQSQAGGKRRRK